MATDTYKEYRSVEDTDFDLRLFVNALKKRVVMLLLIIAAGLTAAGLYVAMTTPVFKVSLPAVSSIVKSYQAEKLVTNIKHLINTNNSEAIEEKLGLTTEEAAQIQSLEFKYNQDNEQYFTIDAFLYHPEAVTIVMDAIQHYFRNNSYNARIINLKRQNLQKQIATANEQLTSVDSIKSNLQHLIGSQNEQGDMVLTYPSNIHLEVVQILEKKSEYKEQLEKLSAITIYETPAPPQQPTHPNKILILGVALLFSVFVGLIVVIFLAYIDQYREQIKAE